MNDMKHIANQNIDNMSNIKVRWDKTHDCSELCYAHDNSIDINGISQKCKKILKTSQVINRREVHKSTLNVKQRIAYDTITRATT